MLRSILVIEDDRAERESLCELFRSAGYLVFAASNAFAARDVLGTMKPGAIVTDLYMPGMSGPELIEKLRSDDRYRGVPIVAISGDPDAAMPEGAQTFLRKPLRPLELLEAVDAYVPA